MFCAHLWRYVQGLLVVAVIPNFWKTVFPSSGFSVHTAIDCWLLPPLNQLIGIYYTILMFVFFLFGKKVLVDFQRQNSLNTVASLFEYFLNKLGLSCFWSFCFFRCDSYKPIIAKLKSHFVWISNSFWYFHSCFPLWRCNSVAVLYMEAVSDPCVCFLLLKFPLSYCIVNKSGQVEMKLKCDEMKSVWFGWGEVNCWLLNFHARSISIWIIDDGGIKVHHTDGSFHVCESRSGRLHRVCRGVAELDGQVHFHTR